MHYSEKVKQYYVLSMDKYCPTKSTKDGSSANLLQAKIPTGPISQPALSGGFSFALNCSLFSAELVAQMAPLDSLGCSVRTFGLSCDQYPESTKLIYCH